MNTLSNYELNVMNTQQLYINLWNQISKKRIETEQKKVIPKKRICFIEQNYEEIETDMNNNNSISKTKKHNDSLGKIRKRREELSKFTSKSLKKEKFDIVVKFGYQLIYNKYKWGIFILLVHLIILI